MGMTGRIFRFQKEDINFEMSLFLSTFLFIFCETDQKRKRKKTGNRKMREKLKDKTEYRKHSDIIPLKFALFRDFDYKAIVKIMALREVMGWYLLSGFRSLIRRHFLEVYLKKL